MTIAHDNDRLDVLLLSMPFGPLLTPSIALGTLKSALVRAGHSARVRYLTIPFALQIGFSDYAEIQEGHPSGVDLLGEWCFVPGLYGRKLRPDSEYFNEVLRGGCIDHRKPDSAIAAATEKDTKNWKNLEDLALRVRSKVEPFLRECLNVVKGVQPRVVGFTTTFAQTMASLALAKRIKELSPDTVILMGGANCQGVMGTELARQYPFIDAVLNCESDLVLPVVVDRILMNQEISSIAGVVTPGNCNGSLPQASIVTNLDDIPIPDYSEYWEQWDAATFEVDGKEVDAQPAIVMEASRGCWWGEKSHCTFCGLNDETIPFRSKSDSRVLKEFNDLLATRPQAWTYFADSILDMSYFSRLVPDLAQRSPVTNIFCETKANLKKHQVKALKDAGFTRIQPGVESLSSSVLQIMRKGVTGIQNVQLLKWCREFGVYPAWNFVWGFPGEPEREYASMAEQVRRLTHLSPPSPGARLRLDRYSPLYCNKKAVGLVNVRPYEAYRHIYPFPEDVVENLAYYFAYDYENAQLVDDYTEPLRQAVANWIESHEDSDLFHIDKDSDLIICDLRADSDRLFTTFRGGDRWIYLQCDAVATPMSLWRRYIDEQLSGGLALDLESIARSLERFDRLGFMMKEADRYLSLSVPLGDYQPKKRILKRLLEESEKGGLNAQDVYSSMRLQPGLDPY